MRPSVRLIKEYSDKKSAALKLRRRGKTYGEIAQIIKASKSTAYDWTKKIKLSKIAQSRIEKKLKEAFGKGLATYNRVYGKIRSREAAKIREKIEEEASKEIKNLRPNDLRLIGSALYWAEGNVKNRNRLQFSNSNPSMIKTAIRFFREICDIPDDKITARAHIYPSINYQKALNFWSKITRLSKKNFKPPQIQVSRASKGKKPYNALPYGTLHLTACNTKIACRVKGWIKGISEKI